KSDLHLSSADDVSNEPALGAVVRNPKVEATVDRHLVSPVARVLRCRGPRFQRVQSANSELGHACPSRVLKISGFHCTNADSAGQLNVLSHCCIRDLIVRGRPSRSMDNGMGCKGSRVRIPPSRPAKTT